MILSDKLPRREVLKGLVPFSLTAGLSLSAGSSEAGKSLRTLGFWSRIFPEPGIRVSSRARFVGLSALTFSLMQVTRWLQGLDPVNDPAKLPTP